jgi:hypothetical protein
MVDAYRNSLQKALRLRDGCDRSLEKVPTRSRQADRPPAHPSTLGSGGEALAVNFAERSEAGLDPLGRYQQQ